MLLGVWCSKEFIKKGTAMISTSTNKMGPGVWFKVNTTYEETFQYKFFCTYLLRLFDKKYSHMIYHTKVSAEPSTVREKVKVTEDVQILTVH